MGLRNDLVHFKSRETVDLSLSPEEIHQKLIGKFRSKNILATSVESVLTPWTQLTTTKAVALWSCQTAARMVVDFVQKFPKADDPASALSVLIAIALTGVSLLVLLGRR